MNQTLLERARCMLSNAGLSRRFWTEVVTTTCYLINHGPHIGIDCNTPYEVWSRKPADYSNLKVFGCPTYYHVSKGKLELREKKRVFVGYGDGVKGSVTFDEDSMLNPSVKSSVAVENNSAQNQVELEVSQNIDELRQKLQVHQQHLEIETQHSEARPYSIAVDRPRRTEVGPPKRYGFEDMAVRRRFSRFLIPKETVGSHVVVLPQT
ncbi:uncharacterized protein LOC109835331 [Asparagus officinalis]|uniref:uncharacterized protein LOC109835331 n=1 Tax=Asparagus officinalis TaxID=4686 RepID=UPI00098E3A56|nr:uncharacterized protein LOC109835331 [Asparagus officinalis]